MSYWGKIIGVVCGYVFGGYVGAGLGLLIGHILDKSVRNRQPLRFVSLDSHQQAQLQPEFITAVYTIMGYISRSMGRTEAEELQMVKHLMDRMGIGAESRGEAMRLFKQGKSDSFPLQNMVGQFYIACRYEPALVEMFAEIQLYAAYCHNRMNEIAKQIILNICYQLDLTHSDYDRIDALVRREHDSSRRKKTDQLSSEGLQNAYAVLNTNPSASDDEVKAAYRRMTSKHHPDKLAAQGLPEELLKMSEAKTREIRAAYERIREVRDF